MIQVNFIEPLVDSLGTNAPIMTRASISHIFANLIDIVHINCTLLEALQSRLNLENTEAEMHWRPEIDDIGDIFCALGPFLSVYKLYCCNFTASMIALESEKRKNRLFSAFLRDPGQESPINGFIPAKSPLTAGPESSTISAIAQ
ncbi:hypothetical protein MRB53_039157 [Persea americana]|nr:hypothetical protein MRB53_039157 [Persea americana]